MENNLVQNEASSHAQPRRTGADRLHSPSRERILRELERENASTVAELAVRTQLHENTVRGHLQRLLADGYVRRQQGEPSGQGRPVNRWRATQTEALHPYAALAVSMTESLAAESKNPRAAARYAGKLWGEQLTRAPHQDEGDHDTRERAITESADALVDQVMREQGFAPEKLDDHSLLHTCPLLSAAHRSDLVCSAHEGMVEAVAQSRDPRLTAQLDPFAQQGACVLRLLASS
ncbi:MAG: helix-turn-helix transcriptional regulator [Canibacter sp.]